MNRHSTRHSGSRQTRMTPWLVASLALTLGSLPTAQRNDALVFRDVRVFDGREVHEQVTVVVQDGRIETIAASATIPPGATVVEGEGLTLLPGLIDAHTHGSNLANLEQALVFGVTTTLDMFASFAPSAAAVAGFREEQRATGAPARADVYSAGALVTTRGGHGTQFGGPYPPVIAGPDEAQRFVDARLAEGSDYIKIVYDAYGAAGGSTSAPRWKGRLPSIDRATLGAVIRAAHARDKLAIVHVLNLESARHALDEGADGLAHLFVDELPDPAFVDGAARRGLFVVPTLSLLRGVTGLVQPASVTEPSVMAYLPPQSEAMLRLTGTEADAIPDLEGRLRRLNETVRRLAAAGVTLLAGTDAFGNPGTTPGLSVHEELVALVDAGLSPAAALAAATSAPAHAFALEDRGRIAAGQRADLLLVRGDPTLDISATRQIVGVWKLGVAADRESFRLRHAEARVPYEALQRSGVSLVADFEHDDQRPTATVGNWGPYDDRPWGGHSTSTYAVVEGGAAGTRRSLQISGTLVDNDPVAVAGALYWPFGPVDLSSKSEIVFWARGSGATYRLIMNGPGLSRIPSAQTFVAGPEWAEIVVPLSGFDGADPHRAVSFAFAAGEAPGEFSLQIDEVRIR